MRPKTLQRRLLCVSCAPVPQRASPETLLSSEFKLGPPVILLVAVSLFRVLGPFVYVSLTVLQHAIDQSSEPVGMAVMSSGTPSLVRKRRY